MALAALPVLFISVCRSSIEDASGFIGGAFLRITHYLQFVILSDSEDSYTLDRYASANNV
ncbi:hypothetical protein [Mucilaginibacter antarcticus]|uniref:hypothetical protein n=1 Tax=Mucilaginibacter antarcticus TaxID=1855725 RepID=UPI00362AD672